MVRVILFFVALAALTAGLAWLADQPSQMVIRWRDYEIETTVFVAVILGCLLLAALMLLWSLLRGAFAGPGALRQFFFRRRQKQGLEALSAGLIAIGAGDHALAARHTRSARIALPNEPLTDLLRAQTAALSGDNATARRIYEAMLASPETELLGLRGLYLEAQRVGEREAARQFAERAFRRDPKLAWPGEALFDLQCRRQDWSGALETLANLRRNGHVDAKTADRRRAVLLAGQAIEAEDNNPELALRLAEESHKLATDLIAPAELAGRIHASRGSTSRATDVIAETWKRAQHPTLALVYAFARPGDSPRDRLKRVKELAARTPHSREGRIAVATAAIDAREWQEARNALLPLVDDDLTQRVCVLMARVEGGERADAGRVREWLARAVGAPRDPQWVADGHVSDRWAPASPVTGQLDAYVWKAPEGARAALPLELMLEDMPPLREFPAGPIIEVGAIDDQRTRPAIAPGEAVVRRRAVADAVTEPSPRDKATPDSPAGTPLGKPALAGETYHAPDDPGPADEPEITGVAVAGSTR